MEAAARSRALQTGIEAFFAHEAKQAWPLRVLGVALTGLTFWVFNYGLGLTLPVGTAV